MNSLGERLFVVIDFKDLTPAWPLMSNEGWNLVEDCPHTVNRGLSFCSCLISCRRTSYIYSIPGTFPAFSDASLPKLPHVHYTHRVCPLMFAKAWLLAKGFPLFNMSIGFLPSVTNFFDAFLRPEMLLNFFSRFTAFIGSLSLVNSLKSLGLASCQNLSHIQHIFRFSRVNFLMQS